MKCPSRRQPIRQIPLQSRLSNLGPSGQGNYTTAAVQFLLKFMDL
jgi:hypothetical protein